MFPQNPAQAPVLRHDWAVEEIREIYDLPFPELMYRAQGAHRQHFNPLEVQRSTLLSLKTGGCTEDCAYCSQSIHNKAEIEAHALLSVAEVIERAQEAKASGSTRFCMSMTGREIKDEEEFERLLEIVRAVAAIELEVCCTLGTLTLERAERLRNAGCSFYNHNLDTSPEYYPKIISTRLYEERLRTLENAQRAGIEICSGGIIGLGEEAFDRCRLLQQLANRDTHPRSVPINMLVRIPGTRLDDQRELDPLEFIRTVATARIVLPSSMIRLAAGRMEMSDEMQALCFLAGANSIFTGAKLLTTPNPGDDRDKALLGRLGMRFAPGIETKTKDLAAG